MAQHKIYPLGWDETDSVDCFFPRIGGSVLSTSLGVAAGTGAVLTDNTKQFDQAGYVPFTAGSDLTFGTLFAIAFNTAFQDASVFVQLQAANAAAISDGIMECIRIDYAQTNQAGFTVIVEGFNPMTEGETYALSYLVIGK